MKPEDLAAPHVPSSALPAYAQNFPNDADGPSFGRGAQAPGVAGTHRRPSDRVPCLPAFARWR